MAYIPFIVQALTHTVFLFCKQKIAKLMGPTIAESFDIFILFGVCNFSSGNRTVGIIDMVRVFIQN